MRHFRDCGLKFHTVVKNGNVTIIEAHSDVILEGKWMDVDLAINDIRDAVAKSLCGASDTWNHVSGSPTSAVDSSLNKLDPDVVRDDFIAGKQTSATMDIDRDQMKATDIHQIANSSCHIMASAGPEMHESQLEIDEYIWHYIAFRYSSMCEHWKQTLKLRRGMSARMIEITGKQQDVINFNEWFKTHDLMSVRQRVIEIPSSIDVNALKALVDSSKAAEFGVHVRLSSSRDLECIGKASDINGLISWLKVALDNIAEHKDTRSSADVEENAQDGCNVVGNVSSHVNSTVAGGSPVTYSQANIVHAGKERLKFKTAKSQLEVEVLNGDLTRQKSEVIVNPANKYLLHSGGAAKAIQSAAGSLLLNECKDYIRRHKELRTSTVMHTTAGNLPRPIKHVIHACGPNARDYPDDRQCLQLLEKTFLSCFRYANDILRVQSLALPAISSGITIFLHLIWVDYILVFHFYDRPLLL